MRYLKKHWVLITILLAATLLRFWHLTAISLWHDEAFSALLIKYNWSEMLYRIGLDVHPPMYYILLRFWHYIFGDSLLALRGMSVFFGVATVWISYKFVYTAFKNQKAAFIAAALVAVNPFQVQYVTEARMYTMGAFFAVLAAYFLTKALHTQKQYFENQKQYIPNLPQDAWLKKAFILYYLLFALSTSLIMYTHYYLFFTTAALGLYGLWFVVSHYRMDYRKYSWFIASVALVAVLYIPWLKIFLFQFRQVGGNYWIPPMDRWSIPTTLWEMLIGLGADISKTSTQVLVTLITIFTLYFLYRFIRKTDSKEKWLVLFNILAPFAGAILFLLLARLQGQKSSVYLVRYFLFSGPFLSIALGVWLSSLRNKVLMRTLLTIYFIVNLAAIFHFWQDLKVEEKPGMAAASTYLLANVEPSHKLYVGSSFEFFNLKYYVASKPGPSLLQRLDQRTDKIKILEPLLYSGGNRTIENLPHFAGTAILTNEELVPDFSEATNPGDIVWLLWTNGFGGSKPTVPSNWEQIDEDGFAEVRPYVGTWVIVTEYKIK